MRLKKFDYLRRNGFLISAGDANGHRLATGQAETDEAENIPDIHRHGFG